MNHNQDSRGYEKSNDRGVVSAHSKNEKSMTLDESKVYEPADDPILTLLGEICVVRFRNKSFLAKLIAVNGGELWFVNKVGAYSMMRRAAITSISKLVPREEHEESV